MRRGVHMRGRLGQSWPEADRALGSRKAHQETHSASGNPLLGLQAHPALCSGALPQGRRRGQGSPSPHPCLAGCGSCLPASGSPLLVHVPSDFHPGVWRPRLSAVSGPRVFTALQTPDLPRVQNRHPMRLSSDSESWASRVRARTRPVHPPPPSTDLSLPSLWAFLQSPQGETHCGGPRRQPHADPHTDVGLLTSRFGPPLPFLVHTMCPPAPSPYRMNGRKDGWGRGVTGLAMSPQ